MSNYDFFEPAKEVTKETTRVNKTHTEQPKSKKYDELKTKMEAYQMETRTALDHLGIEIGELRAAKGVDIAKVHILCQIVQSKKRSKVLPLIAYQIAEELLQ